MDPRGVPLAAPSCPRHPCAVLGDQWGLPGWRGGSAGQGGSVGPSHPPVPPISAGHLLCLVVLMLPVRSLVKLYLHLLTALLLGAGHTVAR